MEIKLIEFDVQTIQGPFTQQWQDFKIDYNALQIFTTNGRVLILKTVIRKQVLITDHLKLRLHMYVRIRKL